MLVVAFASFRLGGMPADVVRSMLFPVKYEQEIRTSSERHGVDPLIVCAVISCESSWDPDVVSEAGATGLMQLMGETSSELAAFGVVDGWSYDASNLTDPATNIEYGCAYLGQLSLRLSSTEEVIAAYNAGPGAVEGWLMEGESIEDAIDFPETAAYLVRVEETYRQYQRLYTPELEPRAG
jgi:soluble lytic murein transglycosylase